ncbi:MULTISPECIES: M1 family metallopeptidase [unclassified Mucilaginibacter]|uniref:M1 family metallopeptidase n=1 Tax=unclassified Mucilaginibacter TaxID=2617802 RepID=UPI00095B0CA5|nr:MULTISPECIES: M1 family metallopeptidase [unclassified Mucilaginibacter]OJW14876.1 MAG: aminopeptidase [Mucilaginibacter sp. 44-25]PLW91393.1 MAG: aminopeptidase [Mucilaginibacter sp.]HEK19561.1 M1 family peptidase [Bacteroidota bacterium]
MKRIFTSFLFTVSLATAAFAQDIQNNPGSNHGNKFEQLGTILSTPNEQRTASGAPGAKYWQQRADYNIKCELDEKNLKLNGTETITYYNNSPDPLTYIWLQLDENEHSSLRNSGYQSSSSMPRATTTQNIDKTAVRNGEDDNGLGDVITRLVDATGKKLSYTINKTMMRIDLPTPLRPGAQFVFTVDWNYKITDRMTVGGRGGYEYFPEDGNYLFTMTQWYPRLCVYSDFQGWQNHQFTGRGEFALTFGNFRVQMTVPADHVIGGTGECINYSAVLSPTKLARYNKAKTSSVPVEIVTLAEAKAAEKAPSTAKKTWVFQANNVRDFAWGSSRKFVWDAMGAKVGGHNVMCMSYYGKEAYNLYNRYSTRLVAHTIKTYSDFSIPYPYPVAQSVEAANGMEYPMICFNYGRTEKDGTYSESTKNGMIGVIIHEVGHNFFPMIVNSDERQWTWMDEGLNSFVEYLAEELWDNKFPTKKGAAYNIIDYMKLPKNELEPIMTNSENIVRFGPNAYSKPATALNILRETIMGRKLFDFAFKEYARRWAFKHPTPADLFRTMEDASGEDLDWFWRGWFYGTDPVDISLDSVKYAKADLNAKLPAMRQRGPQKVAPPAVNDFDDLSKVRNRNDKNIRFQTDLDTATHDFYWKYDRGMVKVDTAKFEAMVKAQPAPQPFATEPLNDAETAKYNSKYFYELNFSNKGGLVMPIIVEFTYKDGTKWVDRIPAQIWRLNEKNASKFYILDKEVASIKLDPMRETADIDESNNYWGKMPEPSKLQLFKQKAGGPVRGQSAGINPMQVSASK